MSADKRNRLYGLMYENNLSKFIKFENLYIFKYGNIHYTDIVMIMKMCIYCSKKFIYLVNKYPSEVYHLPDCVEIFLKSCCDNLNESDVYFLLRVCKNSISDLLLEYLTYKYPDSTEKIIEDYKGHVEFNAGILRCTIRRDKFISILKKTKEDKLVAFQMISKDSTNKRFVLGTGDNGLQRMIRDFL